MKIREEIKRKRIIIFYILAIVLPCLILGILAFRGIKNDQALVEREQRVKLMEAGQQIIRGRKLHPQTQGKIERYHRTMKNVIKLEHYFLPGELERRIEEFVDYYNNHRYHESIKNVTPADVYFCRDREILRRRYEIKIETLNERKRQNKRAC